MGIEYQVVLIHQNLLAIRVQYAKRDGKSRVKVCIVLLRAALLQIDGMQTRRRLSNPRQIRLSVPLALIFRLSRALKAP